MKLSNEAKIGIMVFAVLILLAMMILKTGHFNFSKKGYLMKVSFQNIDGIGTNAPVLLNGLEVGSVKEIVIDHSNDDTKMELVIWLDDQAQLRQGAKAYVKNMGFMGEKYVGLTAGEKGAPVLSPDSTIVGESPADLDKLLRDGQEIAAQLKEVSQNINERLKVNKDHIDRTLANLHSISDNLDERLRVNKEHIDELMSHLHSTSVNLDQFTYDLKLHPWKLLYRSKDQREESIKQMEKPK